MQLQLRLSLLVAGVSLTLLTWCIPMSENHQLLFMVISFVLFGIPHGALDISIEEELQKKANTKKIFLQYVALAFFYIFLWYILPILALILFLLVTAFHFGEIDWIGTKKGHTATGIYFLLGLSWILLLLSYHAGTALGIFSSITRKQLDQDMLMDLARIIFPVSLSLLIATYGFLFIRRQQFFISPVQWYLSTLQTAILLTLALITPLWIFFAFYFGIWHSLLSLDKIRTCFGLKFTVKDWLLLLKKALPFSVMAWIGIIYFILLTQKSSDGNGILSLVFIGLAVLTGPHLLVFTKLSKQ